MAEEKKQDIKPVEEKKAEPKKVETVKAEPNKVETVKAEPNKVESGKAPFKPKPKFGQKRPMRPRRPGGGRRVERPKDEFEQKMVDLARVTRVMAGGKRMKFRACMVIGDKKGRVGVGIAKGVDVAMAIQKAVGKAKKNIITIPIIDGTIPHKVEIKNKASRLMMRPGKKGSGIKAGGVMRIVVDLAGIKDIVCKILGTNNKINNTTTLMALSSFIGQEEKKIVAKPKELKQVDGDKIPNKEIKK